MKQQVNLYQLKEDLREVFKQNNLLLHDYEVNVDEWDGVKLFQAENGEPYPYVPFYFAIMCLEHPIELRSE